MEIPYRAQSCGCRFGVSANSGTSATMLALDARGICPAMK